MFELISMANIAELRTAIEKLEKKAEDVESKARVMFKGLRLKNTSGSNDIAPFPTHYWTRPTDEIGRKLQRDVTRNYQDWYSNAYQYVKAYVPDRVNEFSRYYEGGQGQSNGIINALQLDLVSWDDDSVARIDEYMDMFERQRSLLISIPSKAETDEMIPTKSSNPIGLVCNLCERFQLVVRQLRASRKGREKLDIKDEYDVQYLFHALLQLHFDDIRSEEVTPSYAGGSARMDFLLKTEQIGVETKMSRRELDARKLGSQLMEDIGRYQAHPDCKVLICFVYDPEGLIANPRGVEGDLNKLGEGLRVQVFIKP